MRLLLLWVGSLVTYMSKKKYIFKMFWLLPSIALFSSGQWFRIFLYLFLGLYNNKFNVVQVLESFICSNRLYSQKRLTLKSWWVTFAFSKDWVWQATPRNDFLKVFDICMPIKYEIRILKSQVLKSYRTFGAEILLFKKVMSQGFFKRIYG